MEERKIITFLGNTLTLIGNEIKIGQIAPDFTVLDKDFKEITLKDFSGKIKIISVTPSLDTPVCNMQARKFNDIALKLGKDIVILI